MASRPGCQACAYVTRQLGLGTSCFVHVGYVGHGHATAVAESSIVEPVPLPTLDFLGPFTIREYARLLVVRSRVRERRWAESAAPPK